MFEKGSFTLASRATNLAYKVSFSFCHASGCKHAINALQHAGSCHAFCESNWLPAPAPDALHIMQGLVFAIVGFAAGIVGTSISNGLLAIRQRLDPKFESQNKAPNIFLNAGTWATHMGVSSNVRYQLLNGLDMVRETPTVLAEHPACCVNEFMNSPKLTMSMPDLVYDCLDDCCQPAELS